MCRDRGHWRRVAQGEDQQVEGEPPPGDCAHRRRATSGVGRACRGRTALGRAGPRAPG